MICISHFIDFLCNLLREFFGKINISVFFTYSKMHHLTDFMYSVLKKLGSFWSSNNSSFMEFLIRIRIFWKCSHLHICHHHLWHHHLLSIDHRWIKHIWCLLSNEHVGHHSCLIESLSLFDEIEKLRWN